MMKMKNKKAWIALIAVVLAWSCLMIVAFADAKNSTVNISSASQAAGLAAQTVEATPSSSSGCTGTTYTATDATMTVKNTSGSTAIISFDYAMEGASFKLDGTATTTTGGRISKSLENNGSVVLVATNAASEGSSSKVTASNFSLVVDAPRTLTFNAAAGGSITVGGNAVSTSTTVTANYSTGVAVTATASSGYTFMGWVDGSNSILDSAANTTIRPTADATITPLFVANSSTQTYWGVGPKIYDDLAQAISAASSGSTKKVVLLRDGTLEAQSYTIPSGVTVLIPFDDAATLYTDTPTVIYNSYTTPTAFRTLTMPAGASITVQNGGALATGSKLSSKGQMGGTNGTPTGPDGRIQMMTGSNITLESGANLYCWGYIYGSGNVEAKSGSTVYEAFQVKDWRGGSATYNVYDYVFIFNQYYIQNIEVPMKVNAGASLKLHSSVNASSSAHPIGATLISGTNGGGMFQISDGYVVKDYNEGKDQLTIEIHGNVTMAPLVISGVPMVGTVSTKDYRLPVNNMNIDIQSGKVSISQDLEFLPGSEVTIAPGATFEVSSGKNVYLFDKDDWGNFTGSAKLYAVGYSVANGTTAVRTAANLSDARIDVNGTLEIKGDLYTSNVGADITSTLGFDGTEGKVVFTSAPPSSATTIYECANNSDKTAVTFYPPKLHNGDESYSETISTGKSTWKYDKPGEHWYRFLVDFQYNGTLIQREYYCENNDTVTYDASWIVNDLGATASNGTAAISGTDVNVTGVTADSVVTLTGTPAQYIPTFVLNEKQYSIYQLYTGNTIENTTTIGDATYYVVAQGSEALAVGTAYAAPTDDAMGVTAENHNDLIWNVSGLSYTSGDPYRGTVPAGETNLGPVYIYGFYDGYVAYNSYTDGYYKTLIDAFADTPTDATATITLLADCGTFEDELGTQLYTVYPNNNITLDLNGHKAVGHINNQGVMTLELNGGTLDYHTGATAAAAAYQGMAAVVNSGTMTIQDSVGGGRITADAISNKSGATGSAVVYNKEGGTLNLNGGTLESRETVNAYGYGLLNYGTVTGNGEGSISILSHTSPALYNTGAVTLNLSGGQITGTGASVVTNAANATMNIDLGGGTVAQVTGATAAASAYRGVAALLNAGTLTIQDTVGGGKITTDACNDNSSLTNYVSAVRNNAGGTLTFTSGQVACTQNVNNYAVAILNYGTLNFTPSTNLTFDLKRGYGVYNAGGGTANVEINGKIIEFTTGATAAATAYRTMAGIGNAGTMTIRDSVGGGYITSDIPSNNGTTNTGSTIKNQTTGNLTITNATVKLTQALNANNAALFNRGTVSISGSAIRAEGTKTGGYAIFNYVEGNIPLIEGSTIYSYVSNGIYNYNGASITTIRNSAVHSYSTFGIYNYGATIDTIDNVSTRTDSASVDRATTSYYGLLNRNILAGSHTEASPYTLSKAGVIGTITGCDFTVASVNAIRNDGTIDTITNSTLSGTAGATANANVLYNSRCYYQDAYYLYFTDDSATLTRHYVDDTEHCATIGTISDCTITARQGRRAISNEGHIGTITGSASKGTSITTTKGAYTLSVTAGGKIDEITGKVNITSSSSSYGYAVYVSGGRTATRTITYSDKLGGTASVSSYTYAPGNESEITTIDGTVNITTTNAYAIYIAGGKIGEIKDGAVVKAKLTPCVSVNNLTLSNSEPADTRTGTIGTISGGTFSITAAGTSDAIKDIIANAGTINTISGGTFSSTVAYVIPLHNNATTAEVGEISGGTFTAGATSNAIKNEKGTIGEISGGTMTAPYSTIINSSGGTINAISGGKIKSTGYSAVYNSGTIGEISGGEFESKNTTTSYAQYATLSNRSGGTLGPISGGVFTNTNASGIAVNNDSANAINVTGGHFKGGTGGRATAIADADNTAKFTYPAGKKLSSGTESVTVNGASAAGYYFIADIYTVTFNANDGTAEPATTTQPIESGLETALTANAFTRDGYEFVGWNTEADGSGTSYEDGANITLNTNQTLYAQWTSNGFTVTFKNYDGKELQSGSVASTNSPVYGGATPEKPADAQYSYTFSGWSDGTNTYAANATLPAPTADVTYTAQFTETVNKYSVTFVDENGTTVLLAAAEYDYGTPAASIVKPADPTKVATAQYTYTFAGWTPAITEVTANVTYTATYTETLRSYTVTFVDEDGETVLKEATSYTYGTPAASIAKPADPTREADAQYTYAFAGWTPAIAEVTGNAVYTASYTETLRSYTITWVDGNGNTLKTDTVAYGETPTYIGDTPTKTATAQYTYTFTGWTPTVEAVTGAATYTAKFDSTVNTYTVRWVMEGGAPSEAEIKAGVDAVIAEAAQTIYNEAQTEGEMMWDTGWMTHEALVKMHLDAGGIPTANGSDVYIAKRIIEIVENGSADFSAADALWDSCKDTIVSDFAKFTGYASSDTGTVYSGLTAEQKKALEDLGSGMTVLETDEDVPYGTIPTFDGPAPTKTGYRFDCWYKEADCINVWDFDTDVVTGDTTIYAKWTLEEYELPDFNYGTSSSNLKPASASYDIENGVSLPVIRYYEITSLTMMKGEEVLYSGADINALNTAMLSYFETYGSFEGVTLNAVYTRQTYRMSVISKSPAGEQVEIAERSFKCGQSITLTAPATLTSDGVEYKFAGWWIGSADAAFESVDLITELKITYFSAEPGTFKAIAYYTTEGAALTTSAMPTIKVRDRYTERIGDSYRVCMTLELIAPNDPAVADKYTVSRIGFGYRTIAGNPFSETEYGDFAGWKSGTYVLRFDMPSIDTVVQTYGYAYYEIDGADWKSMVKIDAAQVNYSGESFDELKNVQPTENYWDVTSVQQ